MRIRMQNSSSRPLGFACFSCSSNSASSGNSVVSWTPSTHSRSRRWSSRRTSPTDSSTRANRSTVGPIDDLPNHASATPRPQRRRTRRSQQVPRPVDVQFVGRRHRRGRTPVAAAARRVAALDHQAVPRADDVAASQAARQRLLGAFVAVHQHDGPRRGGFDQGDHLHAVGVGRQPVGAEQTGDRHRRLAQSQFLGAFGARQVQQRPARRFLVLVTGQQDGIVGVLDQFLAVARRRSAGQHPAGGHDDAGRRVEHARAVLAPQDRLDRVGIERMRRAADLVRQTARHKRLVAAIDVAHGADHAVDEHGYVRQASRCAGRA